MEIPLLRESKTFVDRLYLAAAAFDEPRYFMHRRVNWSYRYCLDYYENEAKAFILDPDVYIGNMVAATPFVSDVFAITLTWRQIFAVVAKIVAHTTFRLCGHVSEHLSNRGHLRVYRKGYVDDIELVYDPNEDGVLRGIYPFPINLARQWKYLRYLKSVNLRFRLEGNPYVLKDILQLLRKRDLRSLARLESRAELLQARQLSTRGYVAFQLSDEFNLGSLDFVRFLGRTKASIVNATHGVGKYFPIHRYKEFRVLTDRQEMYYRPERPCVYRKFDLNLWMGFSQPAQGLAVENTKPVQFIFLSQNFGLTDSVIAHEEKKLISLLTDEFGQSARISLFYKPHPNRTSVPPLANWQILSDIAAINSLPNAILASFFSTCHIDTRFVGRKILVKSGLIRPEIAFDSSDDIFEVPSLMRLLHSS